MKFIFYNPNPKGKMVTDCTIRAISKLTGMTWDETFIKLSTVAFEEKDMMSSNAVWGKLLEQLGYFRISLPDECPNCYTVKDVCKMFPKGRYLIAADKHVVTVINGYYYDAWDSGDIVALYLWKLKGDTNNGSVSN